MSKGFIARLPEKSAKKDFVFNILGSTANAAVSVVLLMVVSHVLGGVSAGIFSLGYSTAQMMYTISVFEMRNIQVTDARKEHSFASIFMFRIITTVIMWLFFAFFAILKSYSGEKLAVMLLLNVYMTALSFSDLFQGNLHLNGYLHIAGKSLGAQVMLASVVFTASIVITKNLLFSLALMAGVVALWVFFYDIPFSRNFSAVKPEFVFSKQISVLLCALPLFLSSFMHQYIFNAPKYAIDKMLSEVDQSHYGYLVMPAFFINLLSIFVFRPQLVPLSKNWADRDYKRFGKTVTVLYMWIALVTIAALGCGYLLGIPVLEFLYNADLSNKRGILLILLLAGAFSAGCSLTTTLITIMRKQKYSIVAYAATLVMALVLPDILVAKHGMIGAATAYLVEMALLFIIMFVIFAVFLLKERKKRYE